MAWCHKVKMLLLDRGLRRKMRITMESTVKFVRISNILSVIRLSYPVFALLAAIQIRPSWSETTFAACAKFEGKELIPLACTVKSEENAGHINAECTIRIRLETPNERYIFRTQQDATFIELLLRSWHPVDDLTNNYCLHIQKVHIRKLMSSVDYLDRNISMKSGNDQIYHQDIGFFIHFIRNAEALIEFTEFVDFAIAKCVRIDEKNPKKCKEREIYICSRSSDCLNVDFDHFPVDTLGYGIGHMGGYISMAIDNLHVNTANIPYLRISYSPLLRDYPKKLKPLIAGLRIHEIHVSDSYFKILEDDSYPYLPWTKRLRLTKCNFEIISDKAFDEFPNLTFLDLSGNKLSFIPSAVFRIPKLMKLDVSWNRPQNHRCFDISKKDQRSGSSIRSTITHLVVSNTRICPFKSDSLFNFRSSLQILELRSTYIKTIPETIFTPFSNLQSIDLSNNHIAQIRSHLFGGIPRLQMINLSENRLQDMPFLQEFPSVFEKQSDFDQKLPSNITSRMTTFINISHNLIEKLDSKAFTNLLNTDFKIDLSYNNILSMDQEMLITARNLAHLNLIGNPFDCASCNLRYFQQWLQEIPQSIRNESNDNISEEQSQYVCHSPVHLQNLPILDVEYDFQNCDLYKQKIDLLRVLIPVLSLGIFALILGVLGYRFRWYIRYFMYWFQAQVTNHRSHVQEAIQMFAYDAFICYASQDVDWVKINLIPRLETESGLRLCLHDRNFILGEAITDNIIQSVNDSRKIILVVSEHFLKSGWCNLEAQLAQHKLHEESRSAMIVIKLTDIPPDLNNKSINYLMRTRTYLEWPKDEGKMPLFWMQLENAIRGSSCTQKTDWLLKRQV